MMSLTRPGLHGCRWIMEGSVTVLKRGAVCGAQEIPLIGHKEVSIDPKEILRKMLLRECTFVA